MKNLSAILGFSILCSFSYAQDDSHDFPYEIVIQSGHSGFLNSVAVSPNGKYLATAGWDKLAKIWEISSGREIRTFNGHTHWLNQVIWTNDGKSIVTASSDQNIVRSNILDATQESMFKGHTKFVKAIDLSPNNEILASGGGGHELKLWDFNSGKLLSSLAGHTGDVLTIDFSSDGKQIVSGSGDKTVKVWDVQSRKLIKSIEVGVWVKEVGFSPDGNTIVASSRNGATLYETVSGDSIRSFSGVNGDVKVAHISPSGKYLLTAGQKDKFATIWETQTGKLLRTLEGHTDWVMSACFTPDEKYIVTGSRDTDAILWETITGRIVHRFSSKSSNVSSVRFNKNGEKLIVGLGQNAPAVLWDLARGRPTTVLNGHEKAITQVDINPISGEYITASLDGSAKIWDAQQNKIRLTLDGHEKGILDMDIDPTGQFILTGGYDKTSKLWNFNTGELIRTFNQEGLYAHVYDVTFNPKKPSQFVTASKGLWLWNVSSTQPVMQIAERPKFKEIDFHPTENAVITLDEYYSIRSYDLVSKKVVKEFAKHNHRGNQPHISSCTTDFGSISSLTFDLDGKYVIAGLWNGRIAVWDYASTKLVKLIEAHDQGVYDFHMSPNQNCFVSASEDMTCKLWSLDTFEEIASFTSIGENGYAITTPQGYYTTSKDAVDGVSFVKGMTPYGFENFDLIFNRPDKVIEILGQSSPQLVRSYKNAYLKRLKKMGFTEDQISTDAQLPEIDILNKGFPFETSQDVINVNIKANDKKYNLDRLNVYVNGVPINGIKGQSIKSQHISSIEKSMNIPLSAGKNSIQISVHNAIGVESLKESFNITCTNKRSSNTYVVSIGISDYRDNNYDLNYAAKDANDIAAKFGTNASKVFKITDGNAVKEKVLAIKSELLKSKVDDRVILFVAGHGLLDDNLDYFIGMHDIDFENPAARGLPYDQLEGLLDGIPARKKLMFIDACHSGEVDKDDAVIAGSTSPKFQTLAKLDAGTTIASRGFKTIASKSEGLGLQNSFELMQQLFADLRKGTGAVVISSASGAEFALESDAWKNGVFTYSILEGLENRKCDANKDGAVQVSELKNYVFDRVSALTNGKQHPTSRRENLEFDFVVW